MAKKVYFIDIDGTICTSVKDAKYHEAKPFLDRIELYNQLYENNTVIYWTARGTTTGIDWLELTTKQLDEWGVKYHDVRVGKPFYDVFIDDKSINPNE
jgi:hypothetical protein